MCRAGRLHELWRGGHAEFNAFFVGDAVVEGENERPLSLTHRLATFIRMFTCRVFHAFFVGDAVVEGESLFLTVGSEKGLDACLLVVGVFPLTRV